MILGLGLYDVSWSYFTIRGQIPQMENKVQSGNNNQHFFSSNKTNVLHSCCIIWCFVY